MQLKIILLIFIFSLSYSQDIYRPNDISGNVFHFSPKLSWNPPMIMNENEWLINWNQNYAAGGGSWWVGGSPMTAFQRYTIEMLEPLVGKTITTLSFVPGAGAIFKPVVYAVPPGVVPDWYDDEYLVLTGNRLLPDDLNLLQWNYVDLNNHTPDPDYTNLLGWSFDEDTIPSSYVITDSLELWFGYMVYNYTAEWPGPCGNDLGPAIDSLGNVWVFCNPDTCYFNTSLPEVDLNYNIALYAEDETNDLGLKHYNIYENGVLSDSASVNMTSIQNTGYELIDLGQRDFGDYQYYVTAVYDTFESNHSDTIELNIFNSPPEDFMQLNPPDGSEFSISTSDVLDQMQFVWTPSGDIDGQQLYYGLKICEVSEDSSNCTIFETSNNLLLIQYNVLISELGLTSSSSYLEWSVFATDGFDSTYSSTGVHSIELTCDFLSINDNTIPGKFTLLAAYPNPFNPMVNIHYILPKNGNVELIIYDMKGNIIRNVKFEEQTSGHNKIVWDATNNLGKNISTGIYLYTVRAGNYLESEKLIYIK